MPAGSYFTRDYFGTTLYPTVAPAPDAHGSDASGGYFAPSYFGAALGVWSGPELAGRDPADVTEDLAESRGESAIMLWIAARLSGSQLFETVWIGRSPQGFGAGSETPRAWIYPVGFREVNDSIEVSRRASSIRVHLSVRDDGSTDEAAAYRQLESLAESVCALVEDGPDWVDPSAGGLNQGTYDTPPTATSATAKPLLPDLGLGLVFVYSWDREKPLI